MKSGLWVGEFQHSGQHGVSGGGLGGVGGPVTERSRHEEVIKT